MGQLGTNYSSKANLKLSPLYSKIFARKAVTAIPPFLHERPRNFIVPPSQRERIGLPPVPILELMVAAWDSETISTEQVVDIAFIHRHDLKRRSTENLICTFVRGDSMFPVIGDGAIVCVDLKVRPEGKKIPKWSIWAVKKDEGAAVKYIQVGEDMIALLSANPNYPPEAVEDPEAIIGRVVWMWQAV